MSKPWSDHERDLAHKFFAAKVPVKEIALALDRSHASVHAMLYRKQGTSAVIYCTESQGPKLTRAEQKWKHLLGDQRFESVTVKPTIQYREQTEGVWL